VLEQSWLEEHRRRWSCAACRSAHAKRHSSVKLLHVECSLQGRIGRTGKVAIAEAIATKEDSALCMLMGFQLSQHLDVLVSDEFKQRTNGEYIPKRHLAHRVSLQKGDPSKDKYARKHAHKYTHRVRCTTQEILSWLVGTIYKRCTQSSYIEGRSAPLSMHTL
jgi:hypothetical protein